jgi:hypothetical protein
MTATTTLVQMSIRDVDDRVAKKAYKVIYKRKRDGRV